MSVNNVMIAAAPVQRLGCVVRLSVADSRRDEGGALSIDRMHLKTRENFARKCIIFCLKFSKF